MVICYLKNWYTKMYQGTVVNGCELGIILWTESKTHSECTFIIYSSLCSEIAGQVGNSDCHTYKGFRLLFIGYCRSLFFTWWNFPENRTWHYLAKWRIHNQRLSRIYDSLVKLEVGFSLIFCLFILLGIAQ